MLRINVLLTIILVEQMALSIRRIIQGMMALGFLLGSTNFTPFLAQSKVRLLILCIIKYLEI